jgi:hypothetical protein
MQLQGASFALAAKVQRSGGIENVVQTLPIVCIPDKSPRRGLVASGEAWALRRSVTSAEAISFGCPARQLPGTWHLFQSKHF